MGLSVKKLLYDYFSKEEVQNALRDIGESTTGNKDELVNRLTANWKSYNRNNYDLLDFLDETALQMICYHYKLDATPTNENALKKRIKNSGIMDSNNKTKKKNSDTKESSSLKFTTNEKNDEDESHNKSSIFQNFIHFGQGNSINMGNNNTINSSESTKPNKHKIIRVILIAAAIATILGVVLQYYAQFAPHIDSTNVNHTAISDSNQNLSPISYEDVWSAYREGQPFTLRLTNCGGPNHQLPSNVQNEGWTAYITPIMVDKNGNAAVIKFGTYYNFVSKGVNSNDVPLSGFTELVGKKTLDPSERITIEFNMTKEFEDATAKKLDKVQLWLDFFSFAPYSDDLNKNVKDYNSTTTNILLTEFSKDASGEWVRQDPVNSLCSNLVSG